MIEWLAVAILLLATLYFFWKYSSLKSEIEQKSKALFDEWVNKETEINERWKSNELEKRAREIANSQFILWKSHEEKNIRNDAIKKSEAVIRGKVTEHLVPYFPNFAYNPKDARFLGTPIDLIIFDGLSDESVENIIFVEVKTGNKVNLTKRERSVRDCIQQGKVSYKTIHIPSMANNGITLDQF